MSAARPLSNLQQELLKLYSTDIGEADLLHIKRFLATYFAKKRYKVLIKSGMKKALQMTL